MQIDATPRARDKILYLLKTRGPLTSSELAETLGITAIAVRQHLQHLEEQELVSHTIRKGKVGRPAHVWHLTEGANGLFPDRHAELTQGVIEAVRAVHGEEGLQKVLQTWSEQQSNRLRELFGEQPRNLPERVAALVKIRNEQGYMAEWEEMPDGSIRLIENHCPIGKAACACEDICEGESQLFNLLLGEVDIHREEHIPGGDRRCLYEIRERRTEA